ncbi:MAG: hypothetical protein RIS54_2239 [Verrucomicrobiota bacterium]|jgi:glycosyltransferase involved in cell wall biosynthesis
MKILLVQDYLRSGGTERQCVFLANAFAAAGHAVTLLTFRPGGAIANTVSPAVTHHALQPRDTGFDWFAPGLRTAMNQFDPDIVVAFGRMANCHAGFLVHGPRPVVIGTMRTGKPLPWLFRRSLRCARHIVANSRAARATLQREHAISSDRVSVIPNSLAFPPLDSPRDRSLRAVHGADNTMTVLLDVAMFRPEKNQRELITIAAGLPADFRWQLWLAGDGPELEPCRRYAQELGLAERVKFPGFVTDPTPLYAAADLAVHTSASEALSNFLIEAQAHGLPAVAYEAQGNEQTMLPGETGALIARGDQTGFRAAITHYAATSEDVRQRARDFARSTFAPEAQVQAYLDLFARLATLPT